MFDENRARHLSLVREKTFEVLLELRRKMSPGDKLAQALHMSAMVVRGYQDLARKRYPHASEREVFLRAAAWRLGKEMVIRAYGWDPDSGVAP